MIYRKTPEEKEQKQLEMAMFETKYEQFLAEKILEKKNTLLSKFPEIKTLFQGWLYGVYVAILDQQQAEKGKLYFLFENIPESEGKYKLNYEIINNERVFKPAELKNFPKSYLTILKRQKFDLKKDKAAISELIAAHSIEKKKKPKDVIKMEYRACDLYYNHKIPTEKVAVTLRLKRVDVERIIKLYPNFKTYNRETK
ncbi:MAG: hypothetical protein A2Y25_11565 [Candidatus Melainabacteria bacterium GWF2_37_15]|nr:MAG: hypothetical protein A2Y25_11565 [Candidatus Melainabacteria bacterium GWF2_37_15]